MISRSSRFRSQYPLWVGLIDFVLLNAVFLFLHVVVLSAYKDGIGGPLRLTLFLFNLSYLPVVLYQQRLHREYVIRFEAQFSSAFLGIIAHFLIFQTLFYFLRSGELSRTFLFNFYILFFIVLAGSWVLERYFLKKYRLQGRNYRQVVIVGAGKNGLALKKEILSDETYGYRFMGFFDDIQYPDPEVSRHWLGRIADLPDYIKHNHIDEIYNTLPGQAAEENLRIINLADQNFVRYYFIPGYNRYLKRKVQLSYLGAVPLMSIRQEPLSFTSNAFVKRAFDLFFSGSVLLLLMPWILLVVTIGIKLTSPGPIFFRQKRTGLHGQEFWCYKFRSMSINKQSDQLQAVKNDPRVTPFGSFLRRSSIDELPQFINVFMGDMSIVGPRPHMLKHTEQYSTLIDKYMIRHWVRPGITGLAQVSGFRGETKELWQMEKRVEYDVEYIENWSLSLDIKIIMKTLFMAFRRDENVF